MGRIIERGSVREERQKQENNASFGKSERLIAREWRSRDWKRAR